MFGSLCHMVVRRYILQLFSGILVQTRTPSKLPLLFPVIDPLCSNRAPMASELKVADFHNCFALSCEPGWRSYPRETGRAASSAKKQVTEPSSALRDLESLTVRGTTSGGRTATTLTGNMLRGTWWCCTNIGWMGATALTLQSTRGGHVHQSELEGIMCSIVTLFYEKCQIFDLCVNILSI